MNKQVFWISRSLISNGGTRLFCSKAEVRKELIYYIGEKRYYDEHREDEITPIIVEGEFTVEPYDPTIELGRIY